MKLILYCALLVFGLDASSNSQSIPSARSENIGPILFISQKAHNGRRFGGQRVFSMNEDGTNIRQIFTDSFKTIADAKWLPDGKRILIAADSLMIINANGGRSHSLPYLARWLVLSPDGKNIAFEKWLGGQDPPEYDVFRMNIDGSNERKLPVQFITDWSRDGTTLIGWGYGYYTDSAGRRGEHDSLTFIDENGNMKRKWGQAGNSVRHPIFSRDGDRIAFISTKGGDWQGIYVMRSDCTQDTILTPRQFVFNQPVAWSPDDRELLYNAGGPGSSGMYGKIYTIDVQSRKVRDITPFNGDSAYSFAVSWRRD